MKESLSTFLWFTLMVYDSLMVNVLYCTINLEVRGSNIWSEVQIFAMTQITDTFSETKMYQDLCCTSAPCEFGFKRVDRLPSVGRQVTTRTVHPPLYVKG